MKKVFLDAGAYTGDSIEYFQENIQDSNEYEIHAFEANPDLWHHFDDRDIKFHKEAVWIKDGCLDFYKGEKDMGSTLVKGKKTGGIDYQRPIVVDAIDVDSWIKNNFSKEDYIIFKMDIEGGEVDVLDHMIENGSIDYINEMWIEFHSQKIPEHSIDKKNELIKEIERRGIKYVSWH